MTDLDTALARLDQYLARQLAETSLPGLALALTDRDRTLLTTTHGFADRAARTPVTPDTLFEIGSIGKSFTALALLQLAEAGKLDLHAPVAGYLPWFTVRSDFAPITIHHLLSHTGGIIRGTDHSPGQGYEVWAARQTEAGGPPGERFHYSNLGYKALGLLLAEVTGKPYEETIRERMLAPLEMAASSAAITHDTRNRLAVGYTPFYDDRPFLPTDPLAPATWLETDTADGCLATTAGDLATYLRLLLNRGRLTDGRIVSEESFTLMTTPVIEVAPGASYGYGLMMTEIDGHPCIGHGGGMVGYHAMMLGDLDAGLGVVVLVNGPLPALNETARYALALLRAAVGKEELPEIPPRSDPFQIPNAADYAGTFRDETVSLTFSAETDRLFLHHQGSRVALGATAPDHLVAVHPDFARFPFRFERDDDRVVAVVHGPNWYRGDEYSGPTTFSSPDEWSAYAGHYRSHNPWSANFRIVLRQGSLRLILPTGEEESLHPIGDHSFRIGDDDRSPERISFDTLVGGVALRANLGGADIYRFFTP